MTPSNPWVLGALVCAIALALRLGLHIGRRPSGVDTWFFLMYVGEIRRKRRFPVRLRQYILQEEAQVYPPLFPLLLALFPVKTLERGFWLICPLLDVAQLAVLFYAVLKITDLPQVAALGGLVYALTPQLIAENRNLNSRALGALLNSLMMLVLFRATVSQPFSPGWFALALIAGAIVLLAHKLTTQAFVFTAFVLALIFRDARYVIFVVLTIPLAFVLSAGFYREVARGHRDVLAFWHRNLSLIGAHQVHDSPIYGAPDRSRSHLYYRPGIKGGIKLLVRLLGENPFVLAMMVTPTWKSAWAQHMYWWAIAVLVLSFLTTFVPVLRVFGQGHLYMKLSAFPAAYTLALGTVPFSGPTSLSLSALAVSFGLSVAAIVYLYRYHRTRRTAHTAHVPAALAGIAEYLREVGDVDVVCLPTMYADYLAYHTKARVYWGGHNAGHKLLEPFFPIIRKRIEELIARDRPTLLVLDSNYVSTADLHLRGIQPRKHLGSFRVYDIGPDVNGPSALGQPRPAIA